MSHPINLQDFFNLLFNLPQYPTRKEIEAHTLVPSRGDIETLAAWQGSRDGRPLTVPALVHLVSDFTQRETDITQNRYMCDMDTRTVCIDARRLSILSTLHEIGHALHGRAELDACSWSIKLYRAVYPNMYAKLKWRGHMLTKS